MKHYEKRKTAKNSKGFYIALSLCLVAVGVAAWTTFDSVNNFTAGEDTSSQVLQTEKTISGVKVPSSSEESSSAVSSSREESSQPESTVSETSSEAQSSQGTENSEAHVPAGASSSPAPSTVTPDILQYPLGNSISVPFSGDALVFSETMQDWRAHTGVDIPGKEGDAVKACAAGIVKEVSGEGLYGLTVVVSHGELTVSYCGLDTVNVKKGDSVPIGGTLGTLGTIPCEEKEESHLHLEVSRSGKRIDPAELLK